MRTLFISYDGLTDPLGRSQILPYLVELATDHEIHVLSFEKRARYKSTGDAVRRLTESARIRWYPLTFSTGWKIPSKLWDLLKMHYWVFFLSWKHRIELMHCRSYLSTQVAFWVKNLSRARLLFDMRGFWVDERLDSGNWRLSRWKDRLLYRTYKWIERVLFANADHVVSLTTAALPRVQNCLAGRATPITVIPCCADFAHFQLSPALRAEGRQELGLTQDSLVICYSGSLGSWYRLPEMLELFRQLRDSDRRWKFLILTQDWAQPQEELVNQVDSALREFLMVRSATRESMPLFLNACDLAVSFITPAASKIASSPTKLAEYWACGLPVICNAGIGDVEEYVGRLDGGLIIKSLEQIKVTQEHVSRLLEINRQQLRTRAQQCLSLEVAGSAYRSVYRRLSGDE